MAHEAEPPKLGLDRYVEYLRLLARLQVLPGLQGKLDASDIVQQTLLKAQQHLDQFRGQTEAEMAGWLRRILANTMADAVRKFQPQLARERSLEESICQSSARLEALLSGGGPSPSGQAMQQEQLFQLAQALAQLPEDQRTAVEWHYLKDASVTEVAEQMGRTRAAVAGYLRRGLQKLRELLRDAH